MKSGKALKKPVKQAPKKPSAKQSDKKLLKKPGNAPGKTTGKVSKKGATAAKPATSKAKVSPLKQVLSKVAAKVLPRVMPTKTAPAPKAGAKPAKVVERKVLSNPYETFMAMWKPKTESFEAGIDRLVAEYAPPVNKSAEAHRFSVIEKIHVPMRKEPLTPVIDELLAERFAKERIHKLGSIASMKPKTTVRLNILKADLRGFEASQAAKDLKVKKPRFPPGVLKSPMPKKFLSTPPINAA